jgi:hypothetical protein
LSIGFGGLFLRSRTDGQQREQTEFRQIVRSCLEKCPEISEIADLGRQPKNVRIKITHSDVIAEIFNPLICVLQLPARFQDWQEMLPDHAKLPETFVVVLDGVLMLVGAISPRNKPSLSLLSFPSVRDKIVEILQKCCVVDIVPPNIVPEELCVSKGVIKRGTVKDGVPFALTRAKGYTLRNAITAVHSYFTGILRSFYLLNHTVRESDKVVHEIRAEEGTLLDNLRGFLSVGPIHVFKRRSIGKKMQLQVATLLGLLSKHTDFSVRVTTERLDFEKQLLDYSTAKVLLEQGGWRHYSTGQTIDKSSVLSIIEYTQGETQTSRMLSMTMWAAIVGSVAGALMYALLTLATSVISN